MNPREYEIMASVEAEHWWYRALRDIITRSLKRFGDNLPPHPNLLDVGCGTGENLKHLQQHCQPDYCGGFDVTPQAVDFARNKCPGADVYVSDVCDPELHCDALDIVISCDVIYIPGMEASIGGLTQVANRMRKGGLFLMNLPAYNWLHSDHDLAVRTSERFVASQARELMNRIGLTPRLVTYRLCALFPFVLASRLPSMLRPHRDPSSATSALSAASPFANLVFGQTMQLENSLIDFGVRMPLGSSVFVVGQKSSG